MRLQILSALGMLSILLSACQKQKVVDKITLSPIAIMLTSKTWQVKKVTQFSSGTSEVLYLKGAANNSDDFSMVRDKFNADGTVNFTDQFGLSGDDGKWVFNEASRMLTLSWPRAQLAVAVNNVKISEQEFSYDLLEGSTDYTQFLFMPVL